MATKSNDIKSKLQAQGATVIDGKSANIVADNIEAFKALLCSPELRNRVVELFPCAFADGELQMDALLQSMGQYADNVEDHESYPISWRGKAEAEKHAQTMTTATLRPCIEESVGKDGKDGVFDSQNLYIEGDNLEVLKVLERSYAGQIKMIYIDPPYNTGNDFIYNDKYADGIQTYLEYTGQKDDKGNDKSTKKETSGASHSNWLSMMYPRLEYAKRLLSDDGVIFISIDEHEHANLKKLCDDIYGEQNYFTDLIWESTTQPINSGSARFGVQKKIEYILMYAKCKHNIDAFRLKLEGEEFKYPHIGKFGKCRFVVIEKSDAGGYKRNTMKYKILGQYPREGKRWQIGEETARQLEKEGKVEIVDGIVKKAIYPEDEIDKVRYRPFWSLLNGSEIYSASETGTAQNGKDELNKIMEVPIGFDTVKPIMLIKKLIYHMGNDLIILDFFSGSGTTAHAVVQQNLNDNTNCRKYIMVQIPDTIELPHDAYQAGFKNIAEIGKERIRRAGKAIKKEHPDSNIDIGFKVFKLDSSNLKKWDDKATEDVKEVSNRLLGAQDMMVPGRSHLDVVYEYMLKYGLTLDWPVECVKVHHKDVYVVAGGMFMVCLDHDLDKEWAKELVQLKNKLDPVDWRVLVADESFGNETKTRDNNAQNIFHTLCDAGLAPVNFIIA